MMEKLLNLKTITLLKAIITNIICANFERLLSDLNFIK